MIPADLGFLGRVSQLMTRRGDRRESAMESIRRRHLIDDGLRIWQRLERSLRHHGVPHVRVAVVRCSERQQTHYLDAEVPVSDHAQQ